MKLHQLRDFIEVARSGSIHQAARNLKLSQPALTKSIRQLEKDLGTPLFDRTARGAVLNSIGIAFLAHAELAANELSRGKDEIVQLLGDQGGKVAVALSGTPSMLFLPGALKTFRRRFPLANVRIVEGILPVMLPGLRDGSLDFAMAPRPGISLGKEFSVTPVFTNRRVVVGRYHHPLRNARSLADLQEAEWVSIGAAGPHAEAFEAPFRAGGLQPPRANIRCESLIALVGLLANTDMLAFLPEQWTESSVTSKILCKLPVNEEIPAPDICLIRREGLPLTPAAELLSDALIREAGYLQPKEAPARD